MARKPTTAPAPVADITNDLKRITVGSDELRERLTALCVSELPAVTTKQNEQSGFTTLRSNTQLIGYIWRVKGSRVRVEAAMSPSDLPEDPEIEPWSRSPKVAAKRLVTEDEFERALAMFRKAVQLHAGGNGS